MLKFSHMLIALVVIAAASQVHAGNIIIGKVVDVSGQAVCLKVGFWETGPGGRV